jgi:hypothetical protein
MSKTTIPTGGITADAVDATKIADDAISEEHLDATALTGHTALGATPADTDELLVSDAGTLKRVDYSYLKGANTDLSNLSSTGKELIASAWVNWTGDNTIGDSQNVSGVTENANGDYTITFSSAMANDDYAVSGLAKSDDNEGIRSAFMQFAANNTSMATGSFRIHIQYENTSLRAPEQVCVMVIGAPS